MNVFDIFIAYVAWEDSGKLRPVLVIEQQDAILSVFNITTQYEGKSEAIRDLPKAVRDGKTPIGKLTDADKQRFLDFLP